MGLPSETSSLRRLIARGGREVLVPPFQRGRRRHEDARPATPGSRLASGWCSRCLEGERRTVRPLVVGLIDLNPTASRVYAEASSSPAFKVTSESSPRS